jgi:hypothetical protein
MAKYSKYQRKPEQKAGPNPLWRGIGCILVFVVPLITYGLMLILNPVIIATGLVPPELLAKAKFPDWFAKTIVFKDIASFFGSIDALWLKLVVFFVLLLLLTAISSLIYTMIYQLVGPPRYTERDAPPTGEKVKAYKR